jgi:AcrR family transcriptional regulator
MPRPSHNLDRKLIAAARAMLPASGFSGLSVREVSRRAGVNVGMFHYYFKTREAFVRRVMDEAYEDFFKTFVEAAEGPGDARRRLRRVLVAFARFARENRVLYTLLLRELLNVQPGILAFAKEKFPRHVSVLMGLMEECRKTRVVRPLPVPMLAMFAMSTMGLPNIVVTACEANGLKKVAGEPLDDFSDALLCDTMIEARADMVLAALAPGGKK